MSLNPHCIENFIFIMFPCLINKKNSKFLKILLFIFWIKIAFILSYIYTINLLNIFVLWSNQFAVFFVEWYWAFWHCNFFQLGKFFKSVYWRDIIPWQVQSYQLLWCYNLIYLIVFSTIITKDQSLWAKLYSLETMVCRSNTFRACLTILGHFR